MSKEKAEVAAFLSGVVFTSVVGGIVGAILIMIQAVSRETPIAEEFAAQWPQERIVRTKQNPEAIRGLELIVDDCRKVNYETNDPRYRACRIAYRALNEVRELKILEEIERLKIVHGNLEREHSVTR